MSVQDFSETMRDAAFAYAADLEERGYEGVSVFSYCTYLDNLPPHYRRHREARGYAVRYTSSAAMDAEAWKGTIGERKGWPVPKFHDRSLTVFTTLAGMRSGNMLSQNALTDNDGILASFADDGVVPMYTARVVAVGGHAGVRPENVPEVPYVILKRFPVHADGDYYPWQVGPQRMYHLIMTRVDDIEWRVRNADGDAYADTDVSGIFPDVR